MAFRPERFFSHVLDTIGVCSVLEANQLTGVFAVKDQAVMRYAYFLAFAIVFATLYIYFFL